MNLWPQDTDAIDKLGRELAEKDQIIEAGRRQDVVKDRTIEERDHKIKKLERELAAWKEHAANPQRGPQGRFRFP